MLTPKSGSTLFRSQALVYWVLLFSSRISDFQTLKLPCPPQISLDLPVSPSSFALLLLLLLSPTLLNESGLTGRVHMWSPSKMLCHGSVFSLTSQNSLLSLATGPSWLLHPLEVIGFTSYFGGLLVTVSSSVQETPSTPMLKGFPQLI